MAGSSVPTSFSLREMAEILIRHQGISQGNYDVVVNFEIAVGAVGPSPESVLPGAMIGVSGFGLVPAAIVGPNTVDAEIVNSAPKKRSVKPKAQAS